MLRRYQDPEKAKRSIKVSLYGAIKNWQVKKQWSSACMKEMLNTAAQAEVVAFWGPSVKQFMLVHVGQ